MKKHNKLYKAEGFFEDHEKSDSVIHEKVDNENDIHMRIEISKFQDDEQA